MRRRAATVLRPGTAAWACCALLAAGAVQAQDVTWTGAGGDDRWSNPDNWAPTRVPGPGDRAVLAALAGGPYSVTVDAGAQIGGFELLGVHPHLEPIELALSAGVTVSGATLLRNALLSGSATFVSGGSLEFAGDVCNDLVDTPLDHTGSIAQWTGADIHLQGDASITNRGRFEILSAQDMKGDVTARFVNEGVLCKQSPDMTTISGITFINNGEVCVTEGTLTIVGFTTGPALEEGAWMVQSTGPSATLDIDGAVYRRIDGAQVTLGGSDSSFPAIDALELVGPAQGSLFKIRSGKIFDLPALAVDQSGQVRIGETATALSTLIVGGPISNSGSVHIAPGAGMLIVDDHFVEEEGEFSGSGVQVGNLANNGAVAPGPDEADSPAQTGLLVIEDGIYRQGEAGRLIIDIEGPTPGEEYDVLLAPQVDFAGGSAGVLEVRLGGTFLPALGDRFEVLRYQERRGEFAGYIGLQGQGVVFRPVYEPQALVLIVAAIECYADCDRSGELDFFDFLCFQDQFAMGCP